jgi:hypothetical protein
MITQSAASPTFSRERRDGIGPQHRRGLRRSSTGAGVEGHLATAVAADEVLATLDLLDVRPAMRMDRGCLAGGHDRLQDPDVLVLQEQAMVSRRGEERIQLVRPVPVPHRRSTLEDSGGEPERP